MSGDARVMLELLSALKGGSLPASEKFISYDEMAIEMGWVKRSSGGRLQITLRGQLQVELMERAWALIAPAAREASPGALHETMLRMIRLLQSEDLWSRRAVQLAEGVVKAWVSLAEAAQLPGSPSLIDILVRPGAHVGVLMEATGVSPAAAALLAAHRDTMPSGGAAREEVYLYLGAQMAWAYAPLIGDARE